MKSLASLLVVILKQMYFNTISIEKKNTTHVNLLYLHRSKSKTWLIMDGNTTKRTRDSKSCGTPILVFGQKKKGVVI